MKRLFSNLGRIRWKLWLGIPLLVVIVLVIAFQAIVRTEWFQGRVRDRVVAELERATGGRVELGAFLFDPSRLSISITRLVVRGTEQPPEPPLLRVSSLRLDLSLQSLLAAQVSLRELQILSPDVHITVAADGTTNLPGGAGTTPEGSMATLVDLAVDRVEVQDGSLYWNSVPYRFSIRGENLQLGTRYEQAEERYAVSFRIGQFGLDAAHTEPLLSEAEGEFYIYRDRIEAPRFLLGAEGLRLEAHGRLQDWQQPQVDVEYQARASVEAWKERLQLPFLGEGLAEVTGKLAWGADKGFAYSGHVQVEASIASGVETTTSASGAETTTISGGGDYSGDAVRARLHNLGLSAFGGHFRGEAEMEDLRGSAPRWRISGDFDEYTIQAILDAARRTGLATVPRSVPWSSRLSGWLRAEGAGVEDVQLSTSLILEAPGELPQGRRSLAGVVDAVYQTSDKTLQFSRVDLSTSASHIVAHGSITADGRSVLDLRAVSQDLTDVTALAQAAGLEAPDLPLELRGEVLLDGNLAGQFFLDRPPLARFAGRLEAEDFRTAAYNWNRFAGEIELQPDRLRIEKARIDSREGNALISIQAPLRDYRFAETGPLSGNVRFADLSIERLLELAGQPQGVAGRLAGEARISGAVENPELTAEVTVREGKLWQEPFESARVSARYAAGRLEVSNFELRKAAGPGSAQPGARVSGGGYFTPAGRRFEFNLHGNDWNLQQLEGFAQAGRPPAGDIGLELFASGRLSQGPELFEELDVSGTWNLQNVTLGEQQLGSLTGKIATQGEQVHLDWQADLLGGEVHGKAELQPAGDQSFRGQMDFLRLQALGVAQIARLPVEAVEGEVDGSFTFSGSLSDPNSLQAEGTITRLEAGLAEIAGAGQRYSLWNPFPMRWSLAGGRLVLDGMRLLGQGTDIGIDGSIPFGLIAPADNNKLDVTVEGDFNLSVVESFRSGIQASGVSTVEVNIRGTMDDPELRGRVQLTNASLRSDEFPTGLSDMAGTLTLNGRSVRIEELKATSGGGALRLTGTAVYEEGSASYRLSADATQVRLRYPANMSSTINGQLTLSGNDLQTLLTGEILVTRLATSPEANLGALIASLGEPQRTPAGGPFLRNTQLNVRIGSVPDLPVQTTMFRNMQVEIDMRLVGTAVSPSLLGNVSVTQGEMRFQGTRYVVNRGDIDFTNPFRIEPVLDFEFETRIRDVDIALNVSGPARNMNLSYRSDPPLEFNQLVSLIAVGRSPTTDPVLAAQERVEAQPLIQAGANTLLSQALSRPFNRGLQRFFGVSRLRVDPQVGGAEAVPTARISTEQQITNDLTLIYSYNLADSEQQSVRVEWAPNRRWSFIVTRDENGLVGADVLYKKRLP